MKKNEIIKSVTLKIGGKEITVSPEEAKALFDALADFLNQPKVVECSRPHWWYGPPSYTVAPLVTVDAATTSDTIVSGTFDNGDCLTPTVAVYGHTAQPTVLEKVSAAVSPSL